MNRNTFVTMLFILTDLKSRPVLI